MLTVLETTDGKLLTKTFTMNSDGTVTKSAYDNAYRFNAVEQPVANIYELSECLAWLEGQAHCCVIRGRVKDGVEAIDVRRLLHPVDDDVAAFEERPQGCSWLLIDFDGVPTVPGLTDEIDRLGYLVSLLPSWFHDATFHYRWSASAGMDNWQTLSCHLWFWLTEPVRSEVIRERIDVEGWECDPSPFDAVHVHYTANPVFVGMADPLGKRGGLMRGSVDAVTLPVFKRPVQPIYPRLIKPMTGNGFESKFEEMLDRIGPNFHVPIRNAINFYVHNAPEVDAHDLKWRVEQAIAMAPSGRSPKSNYGSAYLNRSISGALRK